jgi:Cdc6-like AAA superfamily ATPase
VEPEQINSSGSTDYGEIHWSQLTSSGISQSDKSKRPASRKSHSKVRSNAAQGSAKSAEDHTGTLSKENIVGDAHPLNEQRRLPNRQSTTSASKSARVKTIRSFQLCEEQQKVVDLILQGHNVFYTGSAGRGKSAILEVFKEELEKLSKRVDVVTPTNKTALAVKGQTIWSYAG